MAEYIEREVLRHQLNAYAAEVIYRGSADMITGKDSCNPYEWTRGYQKGVLDATNMIELQTAADVVEVVRCKDCVFRYPSMLFDAIWCSCWCDEVEPNGFCFRGARMDGDSDG